MSKKRIWIRDVEEGNKFDEFVFSNGISIKVDPKGNVLSENAKDAYLNTISKYRNKYGVMIGFGKAFKRFWKGYFNFHDKAPRSEFWFALLSIELIYMFLNLLNMAGINSAATIFPLITFLPCMALTSRRANDAGWSKWWAISFFVGFGIFLSAGRLFNIVGLDSMMPIFIPLVLALAIISWIILIIAFTPTKFFVENEKDIKGKKMPAGKEQKNTKKRNSPLIQINISKDE